MNDFVFGNRVLCSADTSMNNQTVKNLWNGFNFKLSSLEVQEGESNSFVIGDVDLPKILPTQDYAVNVNEKGIAINANNYRGLMEGYTYVLGLIEPLCLDAGKESFKIRATTEVKEYNLKRRMVHYCVFPETDILTIKREIRLAGIMHYTHVVLEFWGMFRYDCLKELAWPNAYSKEEVRNIIREIRELGMEPIPFLNHLGHASMCRVLSGKHVVLDQNPALQSYFMLNGWDWNIKNQKTVELLTKMRKELIDVFGCGEYFHIGCDEADMIKAGTDMSEYLNALTNQVVVEGRKPMLWADMLIPKNNVSDDAIEMVLKSLNPQSILVDWQYNTVEYPMKTFLSLQNKGYKVMEAPWYDEKNCQAAVKTVEENCGYGLMLTTWHFIRESYISAVKTSELFSRPSFEWSSDARIIAATLLRKVTFEKNTYTQSGFCENQIGNTVIYAQ